MSRRFPIEIMLVAALYPTLSSATTMPEITPEQRDYWIDVKANWNYADKQPVLLSAETSTTETLCPPSWEPDHGAVYHTRLTFSFTEHGIVRYCEVCVSDRGRSFRPIDKPQIGTQ